jgi:hypothetical protein
MRPAAPEIPREMVDMQWFLKRRRGTIVTEKRSVVSGRWSG